MLAVEAPSGRIWPQAALETGTYDWKRAATTALVPEDATAATLVLGLESVTGRVWFDEVRVVVTRPPAGPPPAPRPGVAFKGHDLPRLRGTMVSSSAQAADLRVLGKEWNANLIRWQLIQTGRANRPGAAGDYDEWLEGQLRRLDALLPVVRGVRAESCSGFAFAAGREADGWRVCGERRPVVHGPGVPGQVCGGVAEDRHALPQRPGGVGV